MRENAIAASNDLTVTPLAYITGAMPRPVNVPNLLRRFIDRRKKETGERFTQEMAADELGIPVKTFYQWIQGRRTPRGLTLDMLKQRIAPRDAVVTAFESAVDEAQAKA